MSLKFNPITGQLDLVSQEVARVVTLLDEIFILADGEFALENNTEAIIKDTLFDNVQRVMEVITVKSSGELEISSNSNFEVLSV